ncbi:MAG: DEAD/DEAH box helicase family protein [Pseudomonadota bacterium]
MNEAETRAELIDPQLAKNGWGVRVGTKIFREYHINNGKICINGTHGKVLIPDYVLAYRGRKLAALEAKRTKEKIKKDADGVKEAREYAEKMQLETAFASNGKKIYQICLKTATEGFITAFPTPDELWQKAFPNQNEWRDKFNREPFEEMGGSKKIRYYQEIAVNRCLDAIAQKKQRILLTLATGTGKTFIALQIAWKLFKTRWNLGFDVSRRPRILFLADRNILADQAFNTFSASALPDDALVRIDPKEIRKQGRVPTNGNFFFAIFQTFMSGRDNQPYFGQYEQDYFDFIIVDECHRGGANDEGSWHRILEHFSEAVQLGLTATPKRKDNVDTYHYFGEPVYTYSLKEGIDDGFLTPVKIKQITTSIDEYIYTDDDDVIEGEVVRGKKYTEEDFNNNIEIREREVARVQLFLREINQNEKTLVFCAHQAHARMIQELINQYSDSKDSNYCVRVTADDGERGEQWLREFQDNENLIPTILTTSRKLSTGVDARNIRNIVLMRKVKSMIEFKQIIGRGTRLFEGKAYFTLYDFVGAYQLFSDPEWDGEPIDKTAEKIEVSFVVKEATAPSYLSEKTTDPEKNKKGIKVKIKLREGKEGEIQSMIATSFLGPDGLPISVEEMIENLYGTLPDFFRSENELRKIWSKPTTRQALLETLAGQGYGKEDLVKLQYYIDAEKSDLFDVLYWIAFAVKPITRAARVANSEAKIFAGLDDEQKEFLKFVLDKYIEAGVEELNREKLPKLLEIKYHTIKAASELLGSLDDIQTLFTGFQKHLYESRPYN